MLREKPRIAFACWSCPATDRLRDDARRRRDEEGGGNPAHARDADDVPDLRRAGQQEDREWPCAAAPTRSAETITTWRGIRSAQTPPTTRKRICGRKLAASTIPRSDGEPVSPTTANASATGAIVLPSIEIVRPREE